MLSWFAQNIVTIIIILFLAAVVSAIILKLVNDRKKGKTSCGCDCAHCSMSGTCHELKK